MLVKLKNSQLVDTQRIAGVPVELFEFDIHLCIKSVCHVTDHVSRRDAVPTSSVYALKNQVNRPLENMRLKLSMRLKVSCA